ncbi:MAG: diphthine synthase [Candidatus Micrarchaeota archaeon]
MLTIIGTGINFDLTLGAIDALKNADEIYIETYTNLIEKEKIRILEKLINKEVKELERTKVESKFLIEKAKNKKICLLASGDPLTATTHVTVLIDAKKEKVETNIIHNSSVYTVAPGKSGLQIYRFGKTASLVNPRENYKPTSSLDIIRKNFELGMHSLVLLDTEPKPMDAKVALEMLKGFESAVVLSRLGENDEKVIYGKISELSKKELGKPPFSIIIPAKLHPMEEDFLEMCKD